MIKALAVLVLCLSGSLPASKASPPSHVIRTVANRAAVIQTRRVKYDTYSNARFKYTIAYPAGILIPQGEADNGDGQKFQSRDGSAVMIVYGRYATEDETLEKAYRNALGGERGGSPRIVYKLIKRDFYVVSGAAGGKIFYEKTFLKDGVFKTFRIEYPESEKSRYDSVVSQISRSFAG
jgi:hypothetical protein